MNPTTPAPVTSTTPFGHVDTLITAFDATAAEIPHAPALRAFGDDQVITWHDYALRSRRLARSLSERGLGKGSVVAFLLTNRLEFHLLDAAALRLGCVTLSLYPTAAPDQIAFQLDHSGARLVVTERRFLALAQPLAKARGVELLVVDDGPLPDLNVVHPAGAVEIRPDDTVCLIYTSGTTGDPKAVELSHRGILAMLHGVAAVLPPPAVRRKLSYLPAAHVTERVFSHYEPMLSGSFVTTVDDPKLFPRALAAVEPTMVFGVPRVWDKLRAAIESAVDGKPAHVGLANVEWAAVGGAPCPPEVITFFTSAGVPLAEVWGMSETTGISILNQPTGQAGSVGRPIPGVTVSLAPDGELLVRGASVTDGYRDDPVRTAEAFTPDGWLRTGDLASIDPDGAVSIIGRKKELIINSSGKNLSPFTIESAVKAETPLVGHICAIGDARPYLVALVSPDAHATAGMTPEAIRGAVAAAVDRANTRLARVEQIKRFAVVDDCWQAGGRHVTATEKLRRSHIARDYADLIETLYDPTRENKETAMPGGLTHDTLVVDGAAIPGRPAPDGSPAVWSPTSVTLLKAGRHGGLVDGLTTRDDGRRLVDWLDSHDVELDWVYVTHGHGDHFFGLTAVLDRWPNTRVLAVPEVAKAMAEETSAPRFDNLWGPLFGDRLFSRFVEAEAIHQDLELAGHVVRIHRAGHSDTSDTTFVEVPDLSLVIAGDIVYNNVFPYVVETDSAKRAQWRAALDLIAAVNPAKVVAGHRDPNGSDDPVHLYRTRQFLLDFDEVLDTGATAVELFDELVRRYPTWLNRRALWSGSLAQTRLRDGQPG